MLHNQHAWQTSFFHIWMMKVEMKECLHKVSQGFTNSPTLPSHHIILSASSKALARHWLFLRPILQKSYINDQNSAFFLKSEPSQNKGKKHLYEHPHIDNHKGWNFIDGKRASHLLKKRFHYQKWCHYLDTQVTKDKVSINAMQRITKYSSWIG
jgi:hypothetical protein